METVILVRFGIVCQLIMTTFGAIIYRELATILDTLVAAYTKFSLNKFIGIVVVFVMKISIFNGMVGFIILNQQSIVVTKCNVKVFDMRLPLIFLKISCFNFSQPI